MEGGCNHSLKFITRLSKPSFIVAVRERFSTMIGLISIAVAYVIAKALDDSTDYKEPKGKNKDRYK